MSNRPVISSYSYPMDKDGLVTKFKKLAAMEGKSSSELIVQLIEEYVKVHGSGNPTYELSNWVEKTDFLAVPALLTESDTWVRHIHQCNDDEHNRIQLAVNDIADICRESRRERYNAKREGREREHPYHISKKY